MNKDNCKKISALLHRLRLQLQSAEEDCTNVIGPWPCKDMVRLQVDQVDVDRLLNLLTACESAARDLLGIPWDDLHKLSAALMELTMLVRLRRHGHECSVRKLNGELMYNFSANWRPCTVSELLTMVSGLSQQASKLAFPYTKYEM